MKFLEILLTVMITVGAVLSGSLCHASEGQNQEVEILEQSPNFVVDEPHSFLEGTWNERAKTFENSEYEVPMRFYNLHLQDLPPVIVHPSRLFSSGRSTWRLYPSDEVKQKRYMGMEIPEYITKSEGTADVGGISSGTPQRGMKQKLLNSG